MGITQNDSDWRGAIYSSRIARRIYHRTLLGLHCSGKRLQRISRRTSALEDLERDWLRIQSRSCNSLRRAIRRSVKSAATLRLYCRRLADHCPETPGAVGRLYQTQRKLSISKVMFCPALTSLLLVSPPPRETAGGLLSCSCSQ